MADKNKSMSKSDRVQQEQEVDEAFRSEQKTIIPVDLEKEMKQSFIDYAMSVISMPYPPEANSPAAINTLYGHSSSAFMKI